MYSLLTILLSNFCANLLSDPNKTKNSFYQLIKAIFLNKSNYLFFNIIAFYCSLCNSLLIYTICGVQYEIKFVSRLRLVSRLVSCLVS